MQVEITTIPELLIKARGNQTKVSRWINCNRGTAGKYVTDVKAESHVIINGRLMVTHSSGRVSK